MKKMISFVLAAVLALSCPGCGRAAAAEVQGPVLTDAAGRMVSIPENGREEKIAAVYGTAVPFLVAMGLSDQVVAVNCKSNFWKKAVPALNEAGSVGRGVVDLEALAECGATVFFHRANDMETVEAVENLGVDVLCMQAEDLQGIYDTLTLLGDYFSCSERAEEVIAWMESKYDQIDAITAEIPQDQRHTALLMGGELGRVAGGDMIQTWMIEKAGGIPVAAEVENDCNWINVGVETIFQWNPEYIFCTSSSSLDYTAEEVLEDPAWSAVTAVENGNVAVVPSKLDTWDMPGIASVLAAFWMLHQMYPEHFSAEELQTEIDGYYDFMFGTTFDAGYLGYEIK